MQDSMFGSLSQGVQSLEIVEVLPLPGADDGDGDGEPDSEAEKEQEEEEPDLLLMDMESPESSTLQWIDNIIDLEELMEESMDTPGHVEQQQQEQQQQMDAKQQQQQGPSYYSPAPMYHHQHLNMFAAVQSQGQAQCAQSGGNGHKNCLMPHTHPHPHTPVRRTASPALSGLHPPPAAPYAEYGGIIPPPRSSSPGMAGTSFLDSGSSHLHHARSQQQQQQPQPQQHQQHYSHSHSPQLQARRHGTHSVSVNISRPSLAHPHPGSPASRSISPFQQFHSGGSRMHKVPSAPQLEQMGMEQPHAHQAYPSISPGNGSMQALSSSPVASASSPTSLARRSSSGSSSSRSHSHRYAGPGPGPGPAHDYTMEQYMVGSPSRSAAAPHLHGHGHGHAGAAGSSSAGHVRNNSLSGQLSQSLSFSNSPPSLPSIWSAAVAPPPHFSNAAMEMSSSSRASLSQEGEQMVGMAEQQHDSGLQLVHLLLSCAEAVAQDDKILAQGSLLQLQQMVSPMGDSMHRVAAYFTDALHARIMGTGSRSYLALRAYDPASSEEVMAAYQILYQVCPYVKFAHFTSNQAIYEAFDGEERVHIIDLDILQGYQWPTLMQALAARHGGAPRLRITGVGMPLDAVEETGKTLATIAESMQIPFEFHAVGERLENVQAYMLQRRVGEALAVNSVNRLHRLLSMNNEPVTPLVGILHMIREQAPKIVTLVEQEASHNGQFFLGRFLEALHYYSAIFDSLDATLPQESPERAKVEQLIFAQEITNIVSCEGTERVERHEKLERWRKIMESIGFQSVPLSQTASQQSRVLLQLYRCDGYTLVEDKGCLLVGWQDRPIIAASAWRC